MLCFLLDPIGLCEEKFLGTPVLLMPSIAFLFLKWQPCVVGKYHWQRGLIFLVHFVITHLSPLYFTFEKISGIISVYSFTFLRWFWICCFEYMSELRGLGLTLDHLGGSCEFSESLIHSIYGMKLTSKFRVRMVYLLSYTVYVWCAMWWDLIDNNRPRDPPLVSLLLGEEVSPPSRCL